MLCGQVLKKSGDLFRLFNHLEKSLGKQGFGREKKGLSPHITLGREVEPYRGFGDIQKNVHLEQKQIHVTSIGLTGRECAYGQKLGISPFGVKNQKNQKNLKNDKIFIDGKIL